MNFENLISMIGLYSILGVIAGGFFCFEKEDTLAFKIGGFIGTISLFVMFICGFIAMGLVR